MVGWVKPTNPAPMRGCMSFSYQTEGLICAISAQKMPQRSAQTRPALPKPGYIAKTRSSDAPGRTPQTWYLKYGLNRHGTFYCYAHREIVKYLPMGFCRFLLAPNSVSPRPRQAFMAPCVRRRPHRRQPLRRRENPTIGEDPSQTSRDRSKLNPPGIPASARPGDPRRKRHRPRLM
jgi:hypothetical protein